jgi:7-carboxy-7-deazaguanine synthase
MYPSTEALAINEIFGPTIQGEGFSAGQHCLFVRTFGCNLECTWCDTARTWAVTESKAAKTEAGKLFDRYEQSRWLTTDMVIMELSLKWDIVVKPTIIVISGGEPMMQKARLIPLARQLSDWGNRIHIETAGTIKTLPDLDNCVAQYNVSPKLSNSGNDFRKRYVPLAIRSLMHTGKARFKFVVRDVLDFAEIDFIVKELDIESRHVMIMPEGTDAVRNIEIAQDVIDATTERGFGLTFRSHILIWGNKEGV